MNKFQSFQEFLATQSVQVGLTGFVINIFLAALLAFILGRIYSKYGSALSNRRAFAQNFTLMAMTTMLIITIVKSSLALSLGLVGALSIVRFRAAIKEPEELSYLFLTIAIGLGLGANQRAITLIAFVIIVGLIYFKNVRSKEEDMRNLYLTVSGQGPDKPELARIIEVLKKYCAAVNLKRFDESKDIIEAAFLVEFEDFSQLEKTKEELRKINDSVKITFLDNKGLA